MSISRRTIFIKQLEFQALIGVYDFEKVSSSRLRLNLELVVNLPKHGDEIKKVVSYEDVLKGVEALALDHHRDLLETLAEDIALFCMEDNRVHSVDLTIDKPDMFAQTESVGVRLKKDRD
ncbi:MAG: dihydroneopterin aldolase [Alphaproteobacteria bacterium]